jgi:uncharacterized protein YndB with AHSA1/START domain
VLFRAPTGNKRALGTVSVLINKTIGEVWQAVTDASRYPEWLVAAQETDVPAEWPEVGTSFSHRVGVGPLTVPGSTTVHSQEQPFRFELGAGMGWLGESDVAFELDAVDADTTRLSMTEHPTKGLVKLGRRIARPLVERAVDARNRKSLARLASRLGTDRALLT